MMLIPVDTRPTFVEMQPAAKSIEQKEGLSLWLERCE
jgi:hypothetical protein